MVDGLSLPVQDFNLDDSDYCFEKTGVRIEPFAKNPDLLIGQDHCDLIITREFRTVEREKLYVSRSLLGWSVHGIIKTSNFAHINVVTSNENESDKCVSQCHKKIKDLIKSYFDLELIGIRNTETMNSEGSRAIEILDLTSKYKNDHWEVGLLWKSDNTDFPNSRILALKRLHLLEKRLDRDPVYAEKYYREMNRLFDNNFAHLAEGAPTGTRVWYLPHFGVQNIDKPDKVRLVFDAAAKASGISFNNLLIAGPDLLKNLIGVIMRFRRKPYAIKADTRDMFLKIKIIDEDRDAQRFLWRDKDRTSEPREFIMSSLLFGASSSSCTALYIKNENANKFSSRYPEAAKSIVENSYMDDFLDSCDTLLEAIERIRQVTEINKAADWEMHGWAANDESIISEAIFKKHTNVTEKNELIKNGVEKVLGLRWLNKVDELSFNINKTKIADELYKHRPTKRQFLAIIMSIFDPLGLLAPFTTQSRVIMQLLWACGINWEDKFPDNEFILWKDWLKNLETVKQCKIDRCYVPINEKVKSIELHVFCDASERAYAAVAYWRFLLSNGRAHVSIILAKSRVAPLKSTTIPRLELQAALVGTRLAGFILKEHDYTVGRRVFWSDSGTVLNWIKKDPREFKIFVANRLSEIRETTNSSEWRWVPSKENPADDATRFVPDALNKYSRWLTGPKFLQHDESQWPKCITQKSAARDDSELVGDSRLLLTVAIENSAIIDFTRFSSWNRLLFALGAVFRAVNIWKKRRCPIAEILKIAESYCLKMSQSMDFYNEIAALRNSKYIPKNSRILNLNVVLDEHGLLRAEGRLNRFSSRIFDAKLIVLDGKNIVARLILKHYHEKYCHASHETVANEIRQRYWIVGMRQALRSLVNKCIVCKMLRSQPINPKMASLPDARLAFRMRPFTHCGLDYFGPITVKIGRRHEKRWCALFTCLTTRAIHLELANSLLADSAIMAIKRFSGRRGKPSVIYSDNGTNFKAASKELYRAIREINSSGQVNDFSIKNEIKWEFIPPAAPHMGGAWERLVRSVKTALNVILKEQSPTEEVLYTALIEIEHMINDIRDKEALTPNHFLIGSSSGEVKFGNNDALANCSRKHWLAAQYFADQFWKRWLREYLPTLLPRKKWHQSEENLKEEDIVLILDNDLPRNQWKKGVVTEAFPGRDDEVRVVKLRTANGVLERPARKIVKFTEVQKQ